MPGQLTEPDRMLTAGGKEKGMSLSCTRCDGTGFLNLHQIPDMILERFDEVGDCEIILNWKREHPLSDVQICDCCGNGEEWYGTRGEHYNYDDPRGNNGPYAYNGGLCECN